MVSTSLTSQQTDLKPKVYTKQETLPDDVEGIISVLRSKFPGVCQITTREQIVVTFWKEKECMTAGVVDNQQDGL